jgi:hypothetical protein
VDELRRGVERAAESVLGDDAEQLKLAQSELDTLTDQLRREIAQGQGRPGEGNQPGNRPGDPQAPGQNQSTPGNRVAGNDQPGGAGQQPGEQQAGEQPGGQQPGGQQPGGQQPGRQQANNQQAGRGQNGNQPGANAAGGENNPANNPGGQPGNRGQLANGRDPRNAQGGGGGGRTSIDLTNSLEGRENQIGGALDGGPIGGAWSGGPLTGGNFGAWTERLRDVETLVDSPELRAAIAAARERARLVRQDYARKHDKPDWAVVQLEILKPLVEVRSRVAEELARRDPRDKLAPIDRDPVPTRFADSVRRYYEELGKDKPDAK